MSQDYVKRNIPPVKMTLAVRLFLVLMVCLLGAEVSSAFAEQADYFYQREDLSGGSPTSCAEALQNIVAGKPENVGETVKNLKFINVHYWLGDYDNALTSDRRKKNYLNMESLLSEVEANKRGIYCRIELALYLKRHDALGSVAYQLLVDEAISKLDDTYLSALASFNQGDFERAAYAFDLIAPYKDAYARSLEAVAKLSSSTDEKIAAGAATAEPLSGSDSDAPQGAVGLIAMAAKVGYGTVAPKEAALTVDGGPIAAAAREGAISAAANVLNAAVLLPEE